MEKLWETDVLPYQSERLANRFQRDQAVINLHKEKTVRSMRVNTDDVDRYATSMLKVKDMPQLRAPPDAALPQLIGVSIDKTFEKNPELTAGCLGNQQTVLSLMSSCYQD